MAKKKSKLKLASRNKPTKARAALVQASEAESAVDPKASSRRASSFRRLEKLRKEGKMNQREFNKQSNAILKGSSDKARSWMKTGQKLANRVAKNRKAKAKKAKTSPKRKKK